MGGHWFSMDERQMSDHPFRIKLGRFNSGLVKIQSIAVMVILGVMGFINTLEIFLRVFFGFSMMWIAPLTLVLFSWLTFIGATVVFYHKEYIVVDYFADNFFPKAKRFLEIFVSFSVIGFLLFIIYEMPGLIKTQSHEMEVVHLPTYFLSLPILISAVSILLFFIFQIWGQLSRDQNQSTD